MAFDLDGVLADFAAASERKDWGSIRSTTDFWRTLDPLDPDVIPRLRERAGTGAWEIVFVTQRPPTRGQTVQRQSQQWLVRHGFDLPSVIVHSGSRGALAAALDLDVLVDDTVQHCVDVVSESGAAAILVLPEEDADVETNAGRLGINVCRSAGAGLVAIDQAAALSGRRFARRLRGRLAERCRARRA